MSRQARSFTAPDERSGRNPSAPDYLPALIERCYQEMMARKIAAMESGYLEGLLKKHKGNVTRAAERLTLVR